MTRREKGPTCISNLLDESQSGQMEVPNFELYRLSTLYSGSPAARKSTSKPVWHITMS